MKEIVFLRSHGRIQGCPEKRCSRQLDFAAPLNKNQGEMINGSTAFQSLANRNEVIPLASVAIAQGRLATPRSTKDQLNTPIENILQEWNVTSFPTHGNTGNIRAERHVFCVSTERNEETRTNSCPALPTWTGVR